MLTYLSKPHLVQPSSLPHSKVIFQPYGLLEFSTIGALGYCVGTSQVHHLNFACPIAQHVGLDLNHVVVMRSQIQR